MPETKEEQPTHAQLRTDINSVVMVQQRIEKAMKEGFARNKEAIEKLTEEVGSAGYDEHGELIGTGIAGSLARLRKQVDGRFRSYDGWVKYGTGAFTVLSIAAVVVWWLIHSKLELLFNH